MKPFKQVEQLVPHKLGDAEIQHKDQEIRKHQNTIFKAQKEKLELSRPLDEKMKESRKEIERLVRIASTGVESKTVQCTQHYDLEEDIILFVDQKGKELWRRPMKEEEREEAKQMVLDLKGEDDQGFVKIKKAKKTKRKCSDCEEPSLMYEADVICVTCKKREAWQHAGEDSKF